MVFPYCIPLLYLWIGGEVYLHTTSARGHLRANIEREPRVCFEVDQAGRRVDYGRFECDSVRLSQRVPVRPNPDRRRPRRQAAVVCEALMAKYGKPETSRPKGFFHGSMSSPSMPSRSSASPAKEQALPPLSEQWPAQTGRRRQMPGREPDQLMSSAANPLSQARRLAST
jgi:hypothetical protein